MDKKLTHAGEVLTKELDFLNKLINPGTGAIGSIENAIALLRTGDSLFEKQELTELGEWIDKRIDEWSICSERVEAKSIRKKIIEFGHYYKEQKNDD